MAVLATRTFNLGQELLSWLLFPLLIAPTLS